MVNKSKSPHTTVKAKPKNWLSKTGHFLWHGGFWRKFFTIIASGIILFTAVSYAVAEWYIHQHNDEPLVLGTTFIPDYAESYGLDPQETFGAILGDLNIKMVRLTSYWSEIEKTPGTYDFSTLDWEFAMANQHHAKVSLAIGLRQPRWPECHPPDWANIDPKSPNSWRPQLDKYMRAVVNRYKNNPALDDYELENEFFMTVFGTCTDFSRQRLVDEFNMVKQADPNHTLIVSRSDNWVGIPVGQPVPDKFAISVYKRVWDATITHRYFEYPLPPWFYASLAGYEQLWSGKPMIIHELQAEPWTPKGLNITETSLPEQYKTMNAQRMATRIKYGEDTGMRTIDLWGAEWWYWLMKDKGDPSVWNTVKEAVAKAQADNQKIMAE